MLIFIMCTEKEIEFSKIYKRTRFFFFLINFSIVVFYGISILNFVENLVGSYWFLLNLVVFLIIIMLILKIPSKEGIFLFYSFLKEIRISFLIIFLFGFLTLNIKVGNVSLEPFFCILNYLGVYVSYCGGDESPKPFEKGTSVPSKTNGRTWFEFFFQREADRIIRNSIDGLSVKENLPGLIVSDKLMPLIEACHSNGAARTVRLGEPYLNLSIITKKYLIGFDVRAQEANVEAIKIVVDNTNYIFNRCCLPLLRDLNDCSHAAGSASLANSEPGAFIAELGLKLNNPFAYQLFLAVKNGDHTSIINDKANQLDECMQGKQWHVKKDSSDDF